MDGSIQESVCLCIGTAPGGSIVAACVGLAGCGVGGCATVGFPEARFVKVVRQFTSRVKSAANSSGSGQMMGASSGCECS